MLNYTKEKEERDEDNKRNVPSLLREEKSMKDSPCIGEKGRVFMEKVEM